MNLMQNGQKRDRQGACVDRAYAHIISDHKVMPKFNRISQVGLPGARTLTLAFLTGYWNPLDPRSKTL